MFGFTVGLQLRRPENADRGLWAKALTYGPLAFNGDDALVHPGIAQEISALRAALTRMQHEDETLQHARDAYNYSHLEHRLSAETAARVSQETAPSIEAGRVAWPATGDLAMHRASHGARQSAVLAQATLRVITDHAAAEQRQLAVALASSALTERKMTYATDRIPSLRELLHLINLVRSHEGMSPLGDLPADLARQLVLETARRVDGEDPAA